MSKVTPLNAPMARTKTAYLVAHVRTDGTPRIVGVGLYSESAKSLTGAIGRGVFAFDVIEHTDVNFEAACRGITDMREPYRSVFAWALDMLPDVRL